MEDGINSSSVLRTLEGSTFDQNGGGFVGFLSLLLFSKSWLAIRVDFGAQVVSISAVLLHELSKDIKALDIFK